VTPVARVAHFREAGGTGRGIRHDASAHRAAVAGQDVKARPRRRCRERRRLERVDPRERWRLVPQPDEEPPARGRPAPDPDQHALGIVPDLADEAACGREPPGVGPEPDPLDEPAHPNRLAQVRAVVRPTLQRDRQSLSPRAAAHMLRIL
jgi:hypothetical protein